MRNRPSRAVPRLAAPALATVALALTLPAALAAPASADGPGSLGVKGWSEKRLRAFETATLGAQHAAEHAKERRFLRTKGGRALLASRRRALLRARSKARKAATCDAATAATLGCWTTDPFSIPVMGINMAMLPTGKVLIYAYPNNPSWGGGSNPAWITR